MLLYYLSYHYIAKGLIITSLDKLTQQIENILERQEVLEAENRKLKSDLSKIEEYEVFIQKLTLRLEHLLTI